MVVIFSLASMTGGTVIGVRKDRIAHMKQAFTSAVNNANNLHPPLCLHMVEYEVDGAHILSVQVPSTSGRENL